MLVAHPRALAMNPYELSQPMQTVFEGNKLAMHSRQCQCPVGANKIHHKGTFGTVFGGSYDYCECSEGQDMKRRSNTGGECNPLRNKKGVHYYKTDADSIVNNAGCVCPGFSQDADNMECENTTTVFLTTESALVCDNAQCRIADDNTCHHASTVDDEPGKICRAEYKDINYDTQCTQGRQCGKISMKCVPVAEAESEQFIKKMKICRLFYKDGKHAEAIAKIIDALVARVITAKDAEVAARIVLVYKDVRHAEAIATIIDNIVAGTIKAKNAEVAARIQCDGDAANVFSMGKL